MLRKSVPGYLAGWRAGCCWSMDVTHSKDLGIFLWLSEAWLPLFLRKKGTIRWYKFKTNYIQFIFKSTKFMNLKLFFSQFCVANLYEFYRPRQIILNTNLYYWSIRVTCVEDIFQVSKRSILRSFTKFIKILI